MTREELPRRTPGWLHFWQHRSVVPVLLALMTLSLLLHLLTLTSLFRIRSIAREQIDALATQVEQAQQDTFSARFALNQPVPINATIPVQQSLSVPISTTVRINQQVNVPLDTPLGSINLPVPLNFEVPVNLEVPIDINQTVDVSTTVNLNATIPINVPIRDTSLAHYLQQLADKLRGLKDQL